MKPSPIAPAANVFICSRLMPVDLRVVPGVRTPRRQVGEQKAKWLERQRHFAMLLSGFIYLAPRRWQRRHHYPRRCTRLGPPVTSPWAQLAPLMAVNVKAVSSGNYYKV